LHLRKRPTAVVMPAPRSQSKRGCGRSGAVIYTTGCAGALGRRRCCGSARKSFQAVMISSAVALCFRRIATDSVWPSSTGTRLHCALMAKGAVIDPHYHTPYSLTVSGGVQYLWHKNWTLSADYVHEQGVHGYRRYEYTAGTTL